MFWSFLLFKFFFVSLCFFVLCVCSFGYSNHESSRLILINTTTVEVFNIVNEILNNSSHILIRSYIENQEIIFESNQKSLNNLEFGSSFPEKMIKYKDGYFGMVCISQIDDSIGLNLLIDQENYNKFAALISNDKEYLYKELSQFFGDKLHIVD